MGRPRDRDLLLLGDPLGVGLIAEDPSAVSFERTVGNATEECLDNSSRRSVGGGERFGQTLGIGFTPCFALKIGVVGGDDLDVAVRLSERLSNRVWLGGGDECLDSV